MKKYVLLLFFGFCSSALAQTPDIATEREIAHLVDHLAMSGCQFNRNGSWYDAERAVAHLHRKRDYLRKKNLLPNTEAFIEHAASQSSVSGEPYWVKCGDQAEVRSGTWFEEELQRYRSSARGADR